MIDGVYIYILDSLPFLFVNTHLHSPLVLRQCVQDPNFLNYIEEINGTEGDKIVNKTQEIKNLLLIEIRRRLSPSILKIKAEFELSCLNYEGIETIRASLLEGEKRILEKYPNCDLKVKEGCINCIYISFPIKFINF